jgi:hypothetical protein
VTAPLGPEGLDLLLAALELPVASLSAVTVNDLYPNAAASLQQAGLLHAEGHEVTAAPSTDHDDVPTAASWCPDRASFGTFTANVGWVPLPDIRLTRYVVPIEHFLGRTIELQRRAPGADTTCIVPDILWELGDVRLPGRSHNVPLWFARRLSHPGVWQQIKGAVRARPPARQRIMLTSTRLDNLHEPAIPRHAILSLHDVLARQEDVRIVPEKLAAYLDGVPAGADGEELLVIGDGREVHLRGEIYRFPKGDTQRRVIMHLYAAYLNGDVQVPTARIIADLDLDPSTRLRDTFKRHPAWGKLLIEKAGLCSFCLKVTDDTAM